MCVCGVVWVVVGDTAHSPTHTNNSSPCSLVVPSTLYDSALECHTYNQCKQLVSQLSPVHYNVFYYLIAFLREVLTHSNKNELTVDKLGKFSVVVVLVVAAIVVDIVAVVLVVVVDVVDAIIFFVFVPRSPHAPHTAVVFSNVLLRPSGIQNISDSANSNTLRKKADFIEQFLKPENELRL